MYNNYSQYPQNYPPPNIVSLEIQPNGIPVLPFPDEKNYIKKSYTKTMLFTLMNVMLPTILLNFFISIVQTFSFAFNFPDPFTDEFFSSFWGVFLTTGLPAIMGVIMFFWGSYSTKINIKSLLKPKKFSPSFLLAAMIIGAASNVVLAQFCDKADSVLRQFNLTLYTPNFDLNSSFATNILMLVVVVVIGPIAEELFFRGFLLKNLSRFNRTFGIITSALIFGLFHLNIPQFIFAFIVGIIAAFLTIKFDTIYPAIALHMGLNLISMALPALADIFGEIGFTICVVINIAFVLIGIILLIYGLAKRKIAFPPRTIGNLKRGARIFWAAPLPLITMILMIIFTLFSIQKC
ncbi:MAG: type II CAAX endopeptidase family protein [Oscillospiraceae bacterium]